MGTAAALHGFDLENTCAVHVLDPGGRMRPTVGLMVHQRSGAPLQGVAGRLASAPAWTAVEVARQLRRPRALAALVDDADHVRVLAGPLPDYRRSELADEYWEPRQEAVFAACAVPVRSRMNLTMSIPIFGSN